MGDKYYLISENSFVKTTFGNQTNKRDSLRRDKTWGKNCIQYYGETDPLLSPLIVSQYESQRNKSRIGELNNDNQEVFQKRSNSSMEASHNRKRGERALNRFQKLTPLTMDMDARKKLIKEFKTFDNQREIHEEEREKGSNDKGESFLKGNRVNNITSFGTKEDSSNPFHKGGKSIKLHIPNSNIGNLQSVPKSEVNMHEIDANHQNNKNYVPLLIRGTLLSKKKVLE